MPMDELERTFDDKLAETVKEPGSWPNIKTVFPRYGDSHVKDTTVARLSYL